MSFRNGPRERDHDPNRDRYGTTSSYRPASDNVCEPRHGSHRLPDRHPEHRAQRDDRDNKDDRRGRKGSFPSPIQRSGSTAQFQATQASPPGSSASSPQDPQDPGLSKSMLLAETWLSTDAHVQHQSSHRHGLFSPASHQRAKTQRPSRSPSCFTILQSSQVCMRQRRNLHRTWRNLTSNENGSRRGLSNPLPKAGYGTADTSKQKPSMRQPTRTLAS